MPSSISSSKRRIFTNGWFRALAGGFVIAFLLLGGWELFWRNMGFTPVIEDDLGIWAVQRRALEKIEGPKIVLLGSSRMQLDVDPRILQEKTGRPVIMLAIDGSSPLPVLADIARDEGFHGLVLCSLLPQWLADEGNDRGRSAKWVRKYHKQKWSFWIETHLSLMLQSHFVFRYPGLLPDELWESLTENEWPRPPYAPMRRDRYRPADYTKIDIEELRAARVKRQREIVTAARPLRGDEFTKRTKDIEAMVRKLGEHGGRVVFLRLPSCGEVRELEQQAWPREKYWDIFAAGVPAGTVHFADYPSLSGYDCPDGSHLDQRDSPRFTRALAEVLDLGE